MSLKKIMVTVMTVIALISLFAAFIEARGSLYVAEGNSIGVPINGSAPDVIFEVVSVTSEGVQFKIDGQPTSSLAVGKWYLAPYDSLLYVTCIINAPDPQAQREVGFSYYSERETEKDLDFIELGPNKGVVYNKTSCPRVFDRRLLNALESREWVSVMVSVKHEVYLPGATQEEEQEIIEERISDLKRVRNNLTDEEFKPGLIPPTGSFFSGEITKAGWEKVINHSEVISVSLVRNRSLATNTDKPDIFQEQETKEKPVNLTNETVVNETGKGQSENIGIEANRDIKGKNIGFFQKILNWFKNLLT